MFIRYRINKLTSTMYIFPILFLKCGQCEDRVFNNHVTVVSSFYIIHRSIWFRIQSAAVFVLCIIYYLYVGIITAVLDA